MAESNLADDLARERATAIRTMLRFPLLDVGDDPDAFRLVARHDQWLTDWFETACGWTLVVDPRAGFGRLGKRAADVDVSRPLRRTRGAAAPFDRRRYQLLCLVCAELVRHPVTTVGLLASAITAEAAFESSRQAERAAFVDALRALLSWGALRTTAGDVDAFLESDEGNAILTADTTRLHRLLISTMAPSALPDGIGYDTATSALLAEPRYGDAASTPEEADEDQRLRWTRHTLARRALDNPVTHLDDCSEAERDYFTNPAGRRWLRDRMLEAGFELEERREGFLAVDLDAIATDLKFPAPQGNAHQLALVIVDRLHVLDESGHRAVGTLSPHQLRRHVTELFASHPGWAKAHQEGDGADRLGADAIDLLACFGLVRVESDGTVVGRPALARYRVGTPVTSTSEPTLFEEDS